MNARHGLTLSTLIAATLAAVQGPACAAPGDTMLERIVTDLKLDASARGAWVNPYMPPGTGQIATESADRILASSLRVYTREVLDRAAAGSTPTSAARTTAAANRCWRSGRVKG